MAEIQLGVIEARYADMIWEHEPVSSSELVKLTEEAFHWKRTTAHNVLRRLCDKGLFRNDNGTVTSLISSCLLYTSTELTVPGRRTADLFLFGGAAFAQLCRGSESQRVV